MSEDELQEKLVRILETQKSLIVIDDIWREGDWDMIKPMLPWGKGWKILLTSRNEGVALRADKKCFTFKPDCLTDEESWTLFRRIAFHNTTENKVDGEMEEMGKEMIKHCGGLPLAVKVLGGLLAEQYTLREWERVYENIKPHIIGGTSFNDKNISSVYNILYLSYEELPVYLKHCFLYLAHFPEDYAISVRDLSHYWAAEGIPKPRYYDGASTRDVGDGYIEELVKRNMVISKRDAMTSRYETCQLHDMMREVCVLKAEEESFVQIVDTNSQLPCKSRRLVIPSRDHTFSIENPKLRSLLRLEHPGLTLTPFDLRFTSLQLMRVLDLSGTKFVGKLPSSIGKLIHLRYLSLHGAYFTHLPSSMRNLKQLIYLNLCVFEGFPVYMPNFLKEIQKLAYLYLPEILHDKVKLELGTLVNLETLMNFSTKHGSVRDLQGMTRLETLSILSSSGSSVETLSSPLNELTNDRDETNTRKFVLDCLHLTHLQLPPHLTTLSLKYCRLEEDPMPILETLLHLKEVTFSIKAFSGRRMVCSRGGFPQLQNLEFYRLDEWEEWIVEEGSMPLLCSLDIIHCDKLKEFPDALRFITSLKDFRVHLNGEEWKNRLSERFLPSRLTTLCLDECPLEEDPMPILEKLLHLKELSLGERSFSGWRMVCSRGGFPQLQKLSFYHLAEWQKWIVEEGSMPLLHTLNISDCYKLKELPDGLRFLTSLKNLSVYIRGGEWKNRLSERGEDYYKVQHIPSVDSYSR